MKFNNVIENIVFNQKLKRIRVKYDPLNKEHEAYKAYSGYEGYVLQECEGAVSIVIMQPAKDMNPMIDVPTSMVSSTQEPSIGTKLDLLKTFLVQKLGEKMGLLIAQLQDIVAIETMLRDNGINDMDLKELYKEFILSNEQI